MDEQTASGGVFRFDLYGTGECAVDCYIDEEPPAEALDHCLRGTDDLLLRVPGGRLCFASAEAVVERNERGQDCAEIPPGDYALRAWLLQPANYHPLCRSFRRERIIGIIALLVFLIFGIIGINQLSTFLALVVLAVILLAGIASGIWLAVTGRGERKRRATERRLRNGPADLVIQMTPITDTDGLVGGGVAVAGGVGQEHPWPWTKCSPT
ncbi:MAG TPA: hypothetical protein DEP45_10115 [Armatimonadetes bacterium]|nr:hypothetical protein [Armatimonadota bacterium]